jgi:hypothetical protein
MLSVHVHSFLVRFTDFGIDIGKAVRTKPRADFQTRDDGPDKIALIPTISRNT